VRRTRGRVHGASHCGVSSRPSCLVTGCARQRVPRRRSDPAR
jgi:hypothetical protein